MKNSFIGYYAPSDDDYKRLWTEGLIVLDTNVLLDLYRLPASARDELINLLETLSDRLWVPYQVALEYQRRRLLVIASERKTIEDALSGATNLFGEVEKRVSALQIDKRGLGIDAPALIKNFEDAHAKLVQAIDAVQKEQLDIAISDPVRQKLDTILATRVGTPPKDQSDLDKLIDKGDMRYDNHIPPGYADMDKDKNPNEANFYHDGMCYTRKFGDLILWRQLLSHTKANSIKSVLLVTSDRKEDWWWREKGKTIGPRPELAREARVEGGIELFWMYSPAQFLESAKTFTSAEVSQQSVNELKDVARADVKNDYVDNTYYIQPKFVSNANEMSSSSTDITHLEHAVTSWLRSEYKGIRRFSGYPGFVLEGDDGRHGVEVKYVRDLWRTLTTSILLQVISRASRELRESSLSGITVIFASHQGNFLELLRSEKSNRIKSNLIDMALEFGIREIIVGVIDEKGDFFVLFREPDIFS